MVIGFASGNKKPEVLKAGKNLKGSDIWATEDYSKQVQEQRKQLITYIKEARTKGHKVILRSNKLIIDDKSYAIEQLKKKERNMEKRNCFATMPFTSEQDRFIVMAHFRSGTLNPDGNWSYSLQSCIEQFMQQYPDEIIEYDENGFGAKMSKHITDFFNLYLIRGKNSDNDQGSLEQAYHNKYSLDKTVTTFPQCSQHIESVERSNEIKKSTSSNIKASTYKFFQT
ncbi:hypothetical protein FQA39_LY08639 [Lamprigera yunnana]|nr:hypothetical protein FQA39_LY08639 [Lamprigera yunnana]